MGGFVRSVVRGGGASKRRGLLRVVRSLAVCRTEAKCSPRTDYLVTSPKEVIRKK